MNNLIKLYKYSLRNRHLFYPIQRLINSNKSSGFTKNIPRTKLFLYSNILTWLGFAKEDEEKESELIMTIKRSILMTQRGEMAKAERMLHLALRLAQEQQNQQGILYVYDLMANLALEQGETDKAEKLFVAVLQKLLGDGTTQQDDIKVIHISLKLARICHLKGETEKAEIGFKWCLDTLEKNPFDKTADRIALQAIIQDWYAHFLLEKGQLNEALKHLKDAYNICKTTEGENSQKSILLLNDLGTVTWRLGDLNTAQEYFNEAVQLGTNNSDFDYLGVLHANLGLVYLQKGLVDEAKKHCKEGWRLGTKQNNPDAIEQAYYCFEQMRTHAS